jgi:Mor family transcriptional regulator
MNDIFIPCSIKFYKSLNDSEMSELVKKMELLNTKIYTVIEIENKIEKMKQ